MTDDSFVLAGQWIDWVHKHWGITDPALQELFHRSRAPYSTFGSPYMLPVSEYEAQRAGAFHTPPQIDLIGRD